MLKSLATLAAAAAIFLSGAFSAAASAEVGDRCIANDKAAGWTVVGLNNGANGPFPPEVTGYEHWGVITRWRTELKAGTGPVQQQLVVFQLAGEMLMRKIGESGVESLVDGRNEFATRIPVPPYSRIGLHGPVETLFCDKEEGHVAGVFDEPFALGEAQPYEDLGGSGVPAIATVESDADGDGYGDQSQDQCFGLPAFHEGCPPIALAAGKARVGKRAISLPVSVESPTPFAVAARVVLNGEARLGKGGKTVFLSSGGVQNLVPGAPLLIDLPLPKPLRQRLDRLGRKAGLKAKLTISVDNADAFGRPPPLQVTVKLPGRRKPARPGR
jgi:hypothetical protein